MLNLNVHSSSTRDLGGNLKCSFTLIELLAVIAIIGIILAFAVPIISDALEKGRRSMCLNNVRQLSIAANLQFYSSQNGLLPDRGDSHLNYGIAAENLLPYLNGNIKVFDCPSNRGEHNVEGNQLPSHPGIYTEYEINGTLGNTNGTDKRVSQISSPSLTAFAYDYPYWPKEPRPHQGGANVGYLDGHASWLKDELMFLGGDEENKFYNLGHQF